MRLFIAIDLSKEVIDEITRLQNILLDDAIICSKAKSFHLTLKFLGEASEKELKNIIEKLKSIKFERFFLKLEDLGVFPDRNNIKVLWLGIEENKQLTQLYNAIKDALPEFKNDKDFSPHLTLARVKSIKDNNLFLERLRQTKALKIEFNINSFILYKSTLTNQGAIYENIEEFPPS